MASSITVRREVEAPISTEIEIVNGDGIPSGVYVGLNSRDHGTAASRGRITNWTSAANQIPLGFRFLEDKTGDTTQTPPVRGAVNIDEHIALNVPVTGLAGDKGDVGRVVYASDNNTFTLTQPTLAIPAGIVIRWRTATVCDVLFFSASQMILAGMAGLRKTWCLGSFALVGGTGNVMTGIVAPHHGRITAVYAIIVRANTDADVNYAINLEIGGVDVTGGVVTCLFSDTVGTKKSGTAVTANNVFHEGDLIDVEAVATVAGTATDVGTYNLYVDYISEPGL
jgi:hypothetical protein